MDPPWYVFFASLEQEQRRKPLSEQVSIEIIVQLPWTVIAKLPTSKRINVETMAAGYRGYKITTIGKVYHFGHGNFQ